jgi:hypothetical protein
MRKGYKMQRTRRKKRGKLKYIIIATVIALIVIITVAVLTIPISTPQLPLAGEYLKIEHTKSVGVFYNQNRTAEISYLGFNVTAVGGDANEILVIPLGGGLPEEVDYPYDRFLAKGETWSTSVGPLQGYVTGLIEKDGQWVFPVEIQIGCVEARNEMITLYLLQQDIAAV